MLMLKAIYLSVEYNVIYEQEDVIYIANIELYCTVFNYHAIEIYERNGIKCHALLTWAPEWSLSLPIGKEPLTSTNWIGD
jgi:hypothetical protein